VDYLPHAGGIGVAVLQAAGDCAIFTALSRRLRSIWLALAIVIVVATAPPDAAISATIWNPPVAIAIAKLGIALALMRGVETLRSFAIVTAVLWMAVQAHTTTLPILMAVIAYGVFAGVGDRRDWRESLRRVGVATAVIIVLQLPWVIHRATVSAAPASTPMGNSITAVLRDPIGAPRPSESAQALIRAVRVNTASPLPEGALALLIVAGAALLLWRSRDRLLQAVAIGPLACAVAVYAVWQGPLNENYWYLAVSTSAALCAFAWIATVEPRGRTAAGVGLMAILAWSQPSRAALAQITLRTPIYGALVDGARATIASRHGIRELRASFAVPEGTDAAYVYTVLGGRLDPASPLRATIDVSGRVSFESIE
jgi:hypothetical protein